WIVTADLIRRDGHSGGWGRAGRRGLGNSQPLPRAAWSWRRWALSSGAFSPVKTRWAPLVRLARMPGVIPGSYSGLIFLGLLVGLVVQAALLTQDGVSVVRALVVDLLALGSGFVGAKLLYVLLQRRPWRQSIGEGWSVDGFLLGTPIVAAASLLAFNLPVGVFLDASAPALFFGVAIGRLGCFFTGCCAGRCTRSRWGVWSSDRRVGARRIPTQLLESAAALLIGVAGLLLVVGYAPSFHGAIFVAAVASYVLVRQFLLRLRAEPHSPARARLTAVAAAFVLLTAAVVLVTVKF
ncbi:MAG: prolipoprotein diacylglyceryl transferase family protein, partial [Dehalococcoidia bacterium]